MKALGFYDTKEAKEAFFSLVSKFELTVFGGGKRTSLLLSEFK